MDSGDDRSSTAGVGPDWPLIPGPTSALFDKGDLTSGNLGGLRSG